jgi:transposase InsO family protein
LAQQRRRYGYRRINAERVWRIWQAEGLSLPRKRPRRRRPGERETLPTRAEQRGHVWTVDFVFDRTERGQVLKLLVVLDEYTRECHQSRVGQRLDSVAVCETLAELFAQHGPQPTSGATMVGSSSRPNSRRGW